MYLKGYELKYGKKIKNIYFRSKNSEMNNSAYIEFEDGTKVKVTTREAKKYRKDMKDTKVTD